MAGTHVLKLSATKCQLIPSIDPQSTLDQNFNQHSMDISIDQYSLDPRLTPQSTLDQHLIDSWSLVRQVLTNPCVSINARWCVCEN